MDRIVFKLAFGMLVALLAMSLVWVFGSTLRLQASPPSQLIEQGADLFFNETFDGNGRTCGTCHRANNFTLTPAFIATLPSDNPLFVADASSTAFIPALAKLENTARLRGARGLILENIDGFDQPPMFRAPPPTINLSFTGPYGLSGEFATIADFTTGAVMQHCTKNVGGDPDNITRVAGQDFRLPTQAELDAMEAFQLSVFVPASQDFNLDDFVTTAAEQSGKDLFFGAAKCSQCHGGTVLSDAIPALGGGNQEFNTGVVNLPINGAGGDNLPQEAGGTRKFSTPPLFNVKNTAPFFHDNSVATLLDAVAFYETVQFNASPGAAAVGGISLTSQEIDDITAFLEALVAPPPSSEVAIPGVTALGLAILAGLMVLLMLWRLHHGPLRSR